MAAPTIAAVGNAYSTPNNYVSPATVTGGSMPTHQAGDVLLMFAFFDTGATTSSQTLSTPAGWTSLGVDADNLTHGMLFHVYFKYAASSGETFTSPSYAGGTAGTSGASGIARVVTLRPSGSKLYPSGVSAANLVANSGTATFITTAAQNITSIGGFTPDENDTLIVVYGGKRDDWTSVATLTGDSLTYTEQIETAVTVGNDAGMVVDTAPQTTAGAIAAKTFTVTGGATEKSCGRAFALSQVTAYAEFTRSAAIGITPSVTSARIIESLRSASVTLTPDLVSAGTVEHVHSRSASVTLTPDVASDGEVEAGAFSPTSIAGLECWLKADAIGLSDGANVTTWEDSHTSNKDATGATGQTLETNEINGLPVVRFDGTDDKLVVSGITGNDATRTVFCVYRILAVTGGEAIWGFSATAALTMTATSGNPRWQQNQAGAAVDLGASGGASAAQMVAARFNSTSSLDAWPTATAIGSPTNLDPNDSYQATATGFALASRTAAGSQFGNIEIGELLIYDSALADADVTSVRDYLTDKWIAAGPTVHERSASVTITPAVASAQQNFSVLERSAAVAITPAIASVPQRVRIRSASVTLTPAVSSAAAFYSILARSAAVAVTPAIATAPQRVLFRATAVSITPNVNATGQIEGGIVTHTRSASVTLTPAVASSATFYSIVERSASVTITPAIASAQMRVVMRQASVTLTPAIASSGAILQIWSRSAAVTLTPAISVAGFAGTIFQTHLPLTVEVRDALLTVAIDEGDTSIIFDSSESTVIYDETTTDVSSQGDREADVPEHLTSVDVAEPVTTVDYEETPRTVEVA